MKGLGVGRGDFFTLGVEVWPWCSPALFYRTSVIPHGPVQHGGRQPRAAEH